MFVKCEGISKQFGNKIALQSVNLEIEQNEIFCLQGANGSGKTTLIKIICDLYKPTSGKLQFTSDLKKKNIGYVSQHFSLYSDLTVLENLSFFSSIYGMKKTKQELVVHLEQFGLEQYSKELAENLSGGWKQKLSLCCATVHSPNFLILDEPTAGVDPVSRKEIWDYIKKLKDSATTILVTTHYMNEVMLCDKVAFLNKGERLLPTMNPDNLLKKFGYTDMEQLFYDAVKGMIK